MSPPRHLLARRGARVTLTDVKPEIAEAVRAAQRGRQPRARRPSRRLVRIGRSRGDESGRAAGAAGGPARSRARHSRDRRVRARVAMAARADRRDHRHQGEIDDDDPRRANAGGVRQARARRRQHRPAAQRASRAVDDRHGPRGRGQQLPARNHRSFPSVDCRPVESVGRPPRSASGCGRVRGGKAAHLRQPAAERLGRGERRKSRRASAGSRHPCARRSLRYPTVRRCPGVHRPRVRVAAHVGRRGAAAAAGRRAAVGAPHVEQRRGRHGDQPPRRGVARFTGARARRVHAASST